VKKQSLEERLSEEDFSPAEIEGIENLLRQAPAPHVRPAHQAQVLNAMTSLLPQPETRLERLQAGYPVQLLYSQIRILRREIWQASALVLALGLLATLALPAANPAGTDFFLFSALAPLVAAVGVALLYSDISRSMLEIEAATRTTGPVLLLARLTLVFGFNLTFGLAGSVVLVFFFNGISLAPLILSWLAPMTFLCGLAFFLSIATSDSLLASGISLLLWLVHLLLRNLDGAEIWLQWVALPGLSQPSSRPLLMLSGSLLVAAALWLLDVRLHRERNLL
jgi:hypothetical protein